jgi:Fur family zinc uptake transcriptional regulator
MSNNEIVLNIIKKSKKYLTAYSILEKFQKVKKVQPMTVYRSLNNLIDKRLIHKSNQNNT